MPPEPQGPSSQPQPHALTGREGGGSASGLRDDAAEPCRGASDGNGSTEKGQDGFSPRTLTISHATPTKRSNDESERTLQGAWGSDSEGRAHSPRLPQGLNPQRRAWRQQHRPTGDAGSG